MLVYSIRLDQYRAFLQFHERAHLSLASQLHLVVFASSPQRKVWGGRGETETISKTQWRALDQVPCPD